MKHELTKLSVIAGFGSVSRCSCGQYKVHVPGVTLHLREEGFQALVQLIAEASRECRPKPQGQKRTFQVLDFRSSHKHF